MQLFAMVVLQIRLYINDLVKFEFEQNCGFIAKSGATISTKNTFQF